MYSHLQAVDSIRKKNPKSKLSMKKFEKELQKIKHFQARLSFIQKPDKYQNIKNRDKCLKKID